MNTLVKPLSGLTSAEAREKLHRSGPNQIFQTRTINFFRIARHEVTEPMILLLLVVGFFYSIWGKLEDAITIFVIIFLLVMAEVYNEYRAKKAIASLEKIAAPRARVMRDGRVVEIATEEVVTDDVLVLSTGTDIAADSQIVTSIGLQCDESALTGETFPVDKTEGDIAYAGTLIISGEGTSKVIATGKETRIGKMAAVMKTIKPPKTPLQLAMKSLVGKLVYVAVFFSVIIPVIGILRGMPAKTMILTGLSLSFATIPEELPIIITMVLGLGAYVLSKKNFLVKRIRAAETLGSATVIVTDKTGTITEGKMGIVSAYPGGKEKEILAVALNGVSQYVLSPMEREIRDRARNLGLDTGESQPLRERSIGKDNRKTKSVIRRSGDKTVLYLSGAPEEVFSYCGDVDETARGALKEETSRGRRVIGIAVKELRPGSENKSFGELETDMTLAGLIAFEDPPRKGVGETIAAAAKAGIRTVMVTGDHSLTAGFIARETGIASSSVMEGKELDALSDEQLIENVRSTSVFARTTPENKYRIVQALQKNGEVVAVTGDGINDVLALKGADIGIAMGIRGTDAAKEAAEVVLADDNYITITAGIFEGRKFFDNLQKGITYYLSVKLALIMIFLLPVLLGVPMPFSPIQIIILELFMDLAASAGFVSEPQERDIFSRPPRGRDSKVLDRSAIRNIFINGATLFAAVMLVYFYARRLNLGVNETQTFAFSAWIFGHIALAFTSRSSRRPLRAIGIWSNKIMNVWTVAAVLFLVAAIYVPLLRDRFNLGLISPASLSLIAAATVVIIGLLETRKRITPAGVRYT